MEKRNIVIILFACVIVVLFGFAIKNNSNKIAAVAPTTYTKEFTYLPSQKTMTVKSSTKPTKTAMGVSKYIVKNKKSADAMADYEKVLTKDGWKVTATKNSPVITATKGSHIVAIVPTQIKQDVQLTVASR